MLSPTLTTTVPLCAALTLVSVQVAVYGQLLPPGGTSVAGRQSLVTVVLPDDVLNVSVGVTPGAGAGPTFCSMNCPLTVTVWLVVRREAVST